MTHLVNQSLGAGKAGHTFSKVVVGVDEASDTFSKVVLGRAKPATHLLK